MKKRIVDNRYVYMYIPLEHSLQLAYCDCSVNAVNFGSIAVKSGFFFLMLFHNISKYFYFSFLLFCIDKIASLLSIGKIQHIPKQTHRSKRRLAGLSFHYSFVRVLFMVIALYHPFFFYCFFFCKKIFFFQKKLHFGEGRVPFFASSFFF